MIYYITRIEWCSFFCILNLIPYNYQIISKTLYTFNAFQVIANLKSLSHSGYQDNRIILHILSKTHFTCTMFYWFFTLILPHYHFITYHCFILTRVTFPTINLHLHLHEICFLNVFYSSIPLIILNTFRLTFSISLRHLSYQLDLRQHYSSYYTCSY